VLGLAFAAEFGHLVALDLSADDRGYVADDETGS
jgi:hypothetical protein